MRGTLLPWKIKTQQPHGARTAPPNRLLKPLLTPGNLRPRRLPLPRTVIRNLKLAKEQFLPRRLPLPARTARVEKVTDVIAIAADAVAVAADAARHGGAVTTTTALCAKEIVPRNRFSATQRALARMMTIANAKMVLATKTKMFLPAWTILPKEKVSPKRLANRTKPMNFTKNALKPTASANQNARVTIAVNQFAIADEIVDTNVAMTAVAVIAIEIAAGAVTNANAPRSVF